MKNAQYKLSLSLEEIELILEALYDQTAHLDNQDTDLNLMVVDKIKEQALLD